jgi:UDP-N-acetyl-2-amino-2-deoxyglucuronate dehydrogenase
VVNFGLIGVAGFVAPRHLRAIAETGGNLLAATDPHDSVGVLDRWFPSARYFPEIERFDRHLEKLRRRSEEERAHFVSICSPNYLHDAHVRLALRLRANAICEKPLVVKPWNLAPLAELEAETGCRVFTVLQLRRHPAVAALRERLEASPPRRRAEVRLTYVTPRGAWYDVSWKGSPEKSGGLVMNVGVHLFDLVQWLFGPLEQCALHVDEPRRTAGVLELERARVTWYLSVEASDVPDAAARDARRPWRAIEIDGEPFDFSEGMDDLYVPLYRDALAGRGLGIEEARPSIEIVDAIRRTTVTAPGEARHPFLERSPR